MFSFTFDIVSLRCSNVLFNNSTDRADRAGNRVLMFLNELFVSGFIRAEDTGAMGMVEMDLQTPFCPMLGCIR